ncbi:2,4-dihydroxyhept-2-ene-1,7-dioic acid aldolase [Candidatus Aerophobetes bacterium]|nr:2,4-dihydroxyhept-2-ene-1,7-dioic acid aldolase [Candidatus Aerophobetes bacterium]
MRKNKLRELIREGKSTIGIRILSSWPGMVEVIGSTGIVDYIEFVGEYAPYNLYDLENLARATELFGMSSMLKVDQEPACFLAQRALKSGIQNILFTDTRCVEDAKNYVQIVKPETPEMKGINGCHAARCVGYGYEAGSSDYVKAMDDVVIALMIEKKGAVDNLEEILSVKGIDMVQFGPCDYSLSIGAIGQFQSPKVKEAELKTIKIALKMGVRPRLELGFPLNKEVVEKYISLGVRDFSLPMDVTIIRGWVKKNGEDLKKMLS